MKILPPTTQPPLQAIERRHRPKKSRRWSDYRACLRWDFAFTCGFCLLHEVDLFGSEGGEGLGGTSCRCPADRQQHEAPTWFAAQTLSLRL